MVLKTCYLRICTGDNIPRSCHPAGTDDITTESGLVRREYRALFISTRVKMMSYTPRLRIYFLCLCARLCLSDRDGVKEALVSPKECRDVRSLAML